MCWKYVHYCKLNRENDCDTYMTNIYAAPLKLYEGEVAMASIWIC